MTGAADRTEAGSSPIGRSVPRQEDPLLVSGRGRYFSNVTGPDMLQVAFVRSPLPHARISRIDTRAARAETGVLAVLTGTDLGDRNGPVPVIWQLPGLLVPHYPALATETVSYAGQPVAAVVAQTRALAEDAAELVEVDYDPLPVVADINAADGPGAVLVHPELGTNEAYRTRVGSADACAAAFHGADAVVEATLTIQRQTAFPLERRGFAVAPDGATGGVTVTATVQHPHLVRDFLAGFLRLAPHLTRVVAPDLGGAFGAYYNIYPEDLVVAWAAHRYRRAVCYIEDRQESFLSTVHARQQHHRIAAAFTRDGRILGLRDEITTDLGAFLDYSGVGPSFYTASFLTGPYRIPAADIGLRTLFTHKVRSGAYRGFGQPQATFVLERLLDIAGGRLGLDPLELRRRNLLRPEEFPYRTATGATMDSGNYEPLLSAAAAAVAEARSQPPTPGLLRGFGVAMYSELTGSSPSATLAARGYRSGGWERVSAVVQRDGSVLVHSGVSHLGQGIRTGLSQICAARLGMEPDQVVVVTGDTARVVAGNRGSVGSRSAVIAGAAADQASRSLAQALRTAAAGLLETAAEDIELAGGRAAVRGVPEKSVGFADIAEAAFLGRIEGGPVVEAAATYDPETVAFGAGAHAAVVDVDPVTGAVHIVDYAIAHDSGVVINPGLVEGQILGGAAQSIGGALLEELVYEADGQLSTGSTMGYLIPTAAEIPLVKILHQQTPAPWHPLGIKGCGEAGTVGPAAALANAVSDAIGGQITGLPLSPFRIWDMVRAAADGVDRGRR